MNETIGSRLERFGGMAPGFDFMRLFLATAVVAWHVNAVVTGSLANSSTQFMWMFGYYHMVGFFAIAGFLIAASSLRLSTRNFLVNRYLRIFPGLAVEVFLSALILGPIFTTLALWDYFTHPGFWSYFSNLFGLINFTLPGVFEDRPSNIINNTLWTVPHELMLYVFTNLVIVVLTLTRTLNRPWLLVLLIVQHIAMGFVCQWAGVGRGQGTLNNILYTLYMTKASRLYIAFWAGALLYLMRDRIPYSWPLFLGSVALAVGLGSLPMPQGTNYPLANLIVGVPLVYATVFLGCTQIWLPAIFRRGDYSYGIYLYGWPIQQLTAILFPQVTWLVGQFALAMVFTALFAAFSWHCVERPVLKFRRNFSFVARVRLEGEAEGAAGAPVGAPIRGRPGPA